MFLYFFIGAKIVINLLSFHKNTNFESYFSTYFYFPMRDIIAILTHLESMVARLESERVSAIERDIALDKLKKLYSDLLEKDALAQPETLLELLFAEDGAPEKAVDEVVDVAPELEADVAPEGAPAPAEEVAEGAPEEEAEGEDVVATAVAVAATVAAAVADVVEDDATDAVAPADTPTDVPADVPVAAPAVFEPEPAEEESAAEPAPAVEPVEEDRLDDEFAALHGLDHNRILSLYDDSPAPAPTAEPAPEVKSEPNDVPEVESATEPEPTELSALEDEPAVELVIDMTEFASPQDGYAAAEEEPTPEPSAEEEPQEEFAADEEPAEEPASQDSQIPEVELDIEPFFAPVEPEEEPAAEPEELTPVEPEEEPADAPVATEEPAAEPAAEPAPASAKTSEPEDDFDQPKALADYIGLNDKYIILRDLFGGDHDYYEATIDQLDTFDTLNEALLFLYDNFEWNDKLMGTTVLMEILMRRFQ